MKPLGTGYVELLQAEDNFDIPRSKDKALFLSSVTCKPVDDPASFDPEYWVDNLTSPVRFQSAMTNLTARGSSVYLEVGPHSTLAGPLRDICSTLSKPCNYIPCQIRYLDSTATFLSAIGRMYQEAVPIVVKVLFPEDRKALCGLPVCPWDHSGSYWYKAGCPAPGSSAHIHITLFSESGRSTRPISHRHGGTCSVWKTWTELQTTRSARMSCFP
jgi:acyl transferase domain-containing protein